MREEKKDGIERELSNGKGEAADENLQTLKLQYYVVENRVCTEKREKEAIILSSLLHSLCRAIQLTVYMEKTQSP